MTARNALQASAAAPPAPNGQALVVANAAAAVALQRTLERIGYRASLVEDPYAAAVELVRRPLAFRAVVLSLSAVYPEELRLIEMIKRRFGHVEVILADAAGRGATIEEAAGRGADAMLKDGRLQRVGPPGGAWPVPAATRPPEPATIEGVLSADEIKALLG